jgi:AraC-like DNA-binding protein
MKISARAAVQDGPVIVFANWFQFGAGERTAHARVQSRMLLWCREGKGLARVNGEGRMLVPGDWLLLPWAHAIEYEADAEAPFLVGGVHVVPRHALTKPVVFSASHFADDKLADLPERGDAEWPKLGGLVQGRFADGDRLALLANYIVERFQAAPPEEATMRTLGGLLVQELTAAVEMRRAGGALIPGELWRMQEYARAHLAQNLSIEDLARVAGCSGASVHRLFRDYATSAPGRWMARMRAQRAAELLRTTRLSVREVGEQVGLPDPFHFSRFFKRHTGVSPRAYQQSRRGL